MCNRSFPVDHFMYLLEENHTHFLEKELYYWRRKGPSTFRGGGSCWIESSAKMVEIIEREGRSLEVTPTWSVATLTTFMVFICLIVERSIFRFGKVSRFAFLVCDSL